MTDKQIKEFLKVPHSTLWTWKFAKSTQYKNKIYQLLKKLNGEYVEFLLNENLAEHTTGNIEEIMTNYINEVSIIIQKINTKEILSLQDLITVNNKLFYNLHRFVGFYVILSILKYEISFNRYIDTYLNAYKIIEKTLKSQKEILIYFNKEIFQDIDCYATIVYWKLKENKGLYEPLLSELINQNTYLIDNALSFVMIINNSEAQKILQKYFSSKIFDNNREKMIQNYLLSNQKMTQVLNSHKGYEKYNQEFIDKIGSLYKKIMFFNFLNKK